MNTKSNSPLIQQARNIVSYDEHGRIPPGLRNAWRRAFGMDPVDEARRFVREFDKFTGVCFWLYLLDVISVVVALCMPIFGSTWRAALLVGGGMAIILVVLWAITLLKSKSVLKFRQRLLFGKRDKNNEIAFAYDKDDILFHFLIRAIEVSTDATSREEFAAMKGPDMLEIVEMLLAEEGGKLFELREPGGKGFAALENQEHHFARLHKACLELNLTAVTEPEKFIACNH